MRKTGVFIVTGMLALVAMAAVAADPPTDRDGQLDALEASSKRVILNHVDTPLGEVFRLVAQAAGFEVTLEVDEARKITLHTGPSTVKKAFIQLAEDHGLVYEVAGPKHLIVRERKPEAG